MVWAQRHKFLGRDKGSRPYVKFGFIPHNTLFGLVAPLLKHAIVALGRGSRRIPFLVLVAVAIMASVAGCKNPDEDKNPARGGGVSNSQGVASALAMQQQNLQNELAKDQIAWSKEMEAKKVVDDRLAADRAYNLNQANLAFQQQSEATKNALEQRAGDQQNQVEMARIQAEATAKANELAAQNAALATNATSQRDIAQIQADGQKAAAEAQRDVGLAQAGKMPGSEGQVYDMLKDAIGMQMMQAEQRRQELKEERARQKQEKEKKDWEKKREEAAQLLMDCIDRELNVDKKKSGQLLLERLELEGFKNVFTQDGVEAYLNAVEKQVDELLAMKVEETDPTKIEELEKKLQEKSKSLEDLRRHYYATYQRLSGYIDKATSSNYSMRAIDWIKQQLDGIMALFSDPVDPRVNDIQKKITDGLQKLGQKKGEGKSKAAEKQGLIATVGALDAKTAEYASALKKLENIKLDSKAKLSLEDAKALGELFKNPNIAELIENAKRAGVKADVGDFNGLLKQLIKPDKPIFAGKTDTANEGTSIQALKDAQKIQQENIETFARKLMGLKAAYDKESNTFIGQEIVLPGMGKKLDVAIGELNDRRTALLDELTKWEASNVGKADSERSPLPDKLAERMDTFKRDAERVKAILGRVKSGGVKVGELPKEEVDAVIDAQTKTLTNWATEMGTQISGLPKDDVSKDGKTKEDAMVADVRVGGERVETKRAGYESFFRDNKDSKELLKGKRREISQILKVLQEVAPELAGRSVDSIAVGNINYQDLGGDRKKAEIYNAVQVLAERYNQLFRKYDEQIKALEQYVRETPVTSDQIRVAGAGIETFMTTLTNDIRAAGDDITKLEEIQQRMIGAARELNRQKGGKSPEAATVIDDYLKSLGDYNTFVQGKIDRLTGKKADDQKKPSGTLRERTPPKASASPNQPAAAK